MTPAAALDELRRLIEAPLIDDARARRLVLVATSAIGDKEWAARTIDKLTLLVPAIELAEVIGGTRQGTIDEVNALLDEIEAVSTTSRRVN